jgi:hypothetical protein
MNGKQKVFMWIGIAAMVLMGLFPPVSSRYDPYEFLPYAEYIQVTKLIIQWSLVVGARLIQCAPMPHCVSPELLPSAFG